LEGLSLRKLHFSLKRIRSLVVCFWLLPIILLLPFDLSAQEVTPVLATDKSPANVLILEEADVKSKALNLLILAKKAIKAEKFNEAIDKLNELLLLPLNDSSEDAQQLIGMSRAELGDFKKAKAEYELYLKLYPEGKYSQVIKARLSSIDNREKKDKQLPELAQTSKKKVKQVDSQTFTGSISQYYYGGKSQETSTNSAGETTKTNMTTQSSLINNISLTGRIKHNEYDTKIVIRDTQITNFMSNVPSYNTVSTGYVEHTNKAYDYMFRVGRQSNVAQGVLGRFDGVFARYGINPQWHVTAVYGEPTNSGRTQPKTNRYFYGAAVEFGPFDQKWSGSVYGIQQIADGLVERRAVGSDLRYFNGNTNFFGTLDYDTVYNEINIAMMQGNWKLDDYTFNLVLDHRKSPILYAESAIQVAALSPTIVQSVGGLRSLFTNDQIYDYVNQLAPVTDLGMLGVSKQLNSKWQLAGDMRVTRTSSTPSFIVTPLSNTFTNQIDGLPSTGNQYALTLQAVAKDLIFKDDSSVIMGNYINDPQYNAYMLSLTNSNTIREKWRLDSTIHAYNEDRNTNSRTYRISPGLRANYYWSDNMSLEAELRVDYNHTNDPVSALSTSRWDESLFLGYRWDVR